MFALRLCLAGVLLLLHGAATRSLPIGAPREQRPQQPLRFDSPHLYIQDVNSRSMMARMQSDITTFFRDQECPFDSRLAFAYSDRARGFVEKSLEDPTGLAYRVYNGIIEVLSIIEGNKWTEQLCSDKLLKDVSAHLFCSELNMEKLLEKGVVEVLNKTLVRAGLIDIVDIAMELLNIKEKDECEDKCGGGDSKSALCTAFTDLSVFLMEKVLRKSSPPSLSQPQPPPDPVPNPSRDDGTSTNPANLSSEANDRENGSTPSDDIALRPASVLDTNTTDGAETEQSPESTQSDDLINPTTVPSGNPEVVRNAIKNFMQTNPEAFAQILSSLFPNKDNGPETEQQAGSYDRQPDQPGGSYDRQPDQPDGSYDRQPDQPDDIPDSAVSPKNDGDSDIPVDNLDNTQEGVIGFEEAEDGDSVDRTLQVEPKSQEPRDGEGDGGEEQNVNEEQPTEGTDLPSEDLSTVASITEDSTVEPPSDEAESSKPSDSEEPAANAVEEDVEEYGDSGSGYSSWHFFGIFLVLAVFAVVTYLCVVNKKKIRESVKDYMMSEKQRRRRTRDYKPLLSRKK